MTLTIVSVAVVVAAVNVLSLYLWKCRRPHHSINAEPRATGSVMLVPAGNHLADSEPGDPLAKRLTMLRGIAQQVRHAFYFETFTVRTCDSY